MIERESLATKHMQSIPVNEKLSLTEIRVMWAGNVTCRQPCGLSRTHLQKAWKI